MEYKQCYVYRYAVSREPADRLNVGDSCAYMWRTDDSGVRSNIEKEFLISAKHTHIIAENLSAKEAEGLCRVLRAFRGDR